jgi:ferric iron reductase protein FhuF
MTDALLDTGMLAGSGVITGPHLDFRRRSCCLFYRVPGRNVCSDCVFRRTRRPNRR